MPKDKFWHEQRRTYSSNEVLIKSKNPLMDENEYDTIGNELKLLQWVIFVGDFKSWILQF